MLAFNYLIRIFFLVQTRQLLFQKTKNTSYALTHFTFPKKRTSASFYFAYLLQSFSCSLSDRRISSFFPRKGTAKKKQKASKKKVRCCLEEPHNPSKILVKRFFFSFFLYILCPYKPKPKHFPFFPHFARIKAKKKKSTQRVRSLSNISWTDTQQFFSFPRPARLPRTLLLLFSLTLSLNLKEEKKERTV